MHDKPVRIGCTGTAVELTELKSKLAFLAVRNGAKAKPEQGALAAELGALRQREKEACAQLEAVVCIARSVREQLSKRAAQQGKEVEGNSREGALQLGAPQGREQADKACYGGKRTASREFAHRGIANTGSSGNDSSAGGAAQLAKQGAATLLEAKAAASALAGAAFYSALASELRRAEAQVQQLRAVEARVDKLSALLLLGECEEEEWEEDCHRTAAVQSGDGMSQSLAAAAAKGKVAAEARLQLRPARMLALEVQRLSAENEALLAEVRSLELKVAEDAGATAGTCNSPKQKAQYLHRVKMERDALRQGCNTLLKERFLLEQCIRYLAAKAGIPAARRLNILGQPRRGATAALLPSSLAKCSMLPSSTTVAVQSRYTAGGGGIRVAVRAGPHVHTGQQEGGWGERATWADVAGHISSYGYGTGGSRCGSSDDTPGLAEPANRSGRGTQEDCSRKDAQQVENRLQQHIINVCLKV